MKALLIGLFALGSISAFADAVDCYKYGNTKIKVRYLDKSGVITTLCSGAGNNNPVDCFLKAIEQIKDENNPEYIALSLCSARNFNPNN